MERKQIIQERFEKVQENLKKQSVKQRKLKKMFLEKLEHQFFLFQL